MRQTRDDLHDGMHWSSDWNWIAKASPLSFDGSKAKAAQVIMSVFHIGNDTRFPWISKV